MKNILPVILVHLITNLFEQSEPSKYGITTAISANHSSCIIAKNIPAVSVLSVIMHGSANL